VKRNRLFEYLDQIGIGAIAHSPKKVEIVDINARIEEMYGYSLTEIKEIGIGGISAEPYSGTEADQRIQAAAEGNTQSFEWVVQQKSGEHLWVVVNLTKLSINNSTYVIATIRDITEIKKQERRLRLFDRITRHNLRNKLNTISGYNSILIEELEQLDSGFEDALGYANKVKTASKDLESLTSRIHNLEKILSDKNLNYRTVPLCELVTDIVSTYQSDYPDVEWVCECDAELRTNTDGRLRLAIEEAVRNAVEHNPIEKLQVSVTVTEHSNPPKYNNIQIKDTGNPIPQSEIDVIEGDYNPGQLTHGEGTGLWAMRSIVESLGGYLSIRSSVQGNIIEFQLPQASKEPPSDSG
jgi:PAS domain S-box-containing protein